MIHNSLKIRWRSGTNSSRHLNLNKILVMQHGPPELDKRSLLGAEEVALVVTLQEALLMKTGRDGQAKRNLIGDAITNQISLCMDLVHLSQHSRPMSQLLSPSLPTMSNSLKHK